MTQQNETNDYFKMSRAKLITLLSERTTPYCNHFKDL